MKGGTGRDFMGKVYMSSKVVRSKRLGWKCEYKTHVGKNII